MTNSERADRALGILYNTDDFDTVETAMIDLVADLHHLAKREGIDFAQVLHHARLHHLTESDARAYARKRERLGDTPGF